ncbi:unnamed protein product, partial [Iphiclides podalirius]
MKTTAVNSIFVLTETKWNATVLRERTSIRPFRCVIGPKMLDALLLMETVVKKVVETEAVEELVMEVVGEAAMEAVMEAVMVAVEEAAMEVSMEVVMEAVMEAAMEAVMAAVGEAAMEAVGEAPKKMKAVKEKEEAAAMAQAKTNVKQVAMSFLGPTKPIATNSGAATAQKLS